MNTAILQQQYFKTASEVRTITVSFHRLLETTESITGTPTATPNLGSITVDSVTANTTTLTVDGEPEPVTANRALIVTVSGGTAGLTYDILLSFVTDATPAQTVKRTLRGQIIADTA